MPTEETKLWSNLPSKSWNDSINSYQSIFKDLYESTREKISEQIISGQHDVVIEVGCGTGNIIGELQTEVTRFGLDINADFLRTCRINYSTGIIFEQVYSSKLLEWWQTKSQDYHSPLILCCNNTLNIMPHHIRTDTVTQMMAITGATGRCFLSFWNGQFFSNAVLNYYQKNPALCGPFDFSHVDFDKRELNTPRGYHTRWLLPTEVQALMRSFDVNIDITEGDQASTDHISVETMGIFVWFSCASSSKSKSYYDSNDAQHFYSSIWGEDTIHIGRYDLLTAPEKTSLSPKTQIQRAETLHEEELVSKIREIFNIPSHSHDLQDQEFIPIRVLDMGCGFGGLLRRLWREGLLWSGTGVDISRRMCERALELNERIGAIDLEIREESYLDVSVPRESVDLVISMDAFLHVGQSRHDKIAQEAARVLRPGGWILFSDITEVNDADPAVMAPVYARLNLDRLGTVEHYKRVFQAQGFRNFRFESHSDNVPDHYERVRQVLVSQDQSRFGVEFLSRMEEGLRQWRDLAGDNIYWGIFIAQRTRKPDEMV